MYRNYHMLSGGKDSTAQVLMAVERGESIEKIVMFDTGWEFPQMYEHVDKLERFIGIDITRLQSKKPFHYWLTERPIVARKGPMKGQVHRIGNGWPSSMRRWCTREKTRAMDYYMRGQSYIKAVGRMVKCIGYAADETNRPDPAENWGWDIRYPLIEWGITEADALEYCKRRGFDWGGLYEQMGRVSCFCCPLQPIDSLWAVKKHHPDLWTKMLKWENEIPEGSNRRFRGNKKLSEIVFKN
jgi:3'-phosphoadenosine 5'-phosphosulfate sulfotransferase (PAPS reductase)/FAD synthetase